MNPDTITPEDFDAAEARIEHESRCLALERGLDPDEHWTRIAREEVCLPVYRDLGLL